MWLGHDEALDAQVAIKVLSGSLIDDLDVRNRFLEEARILRRADSERLVRVHDIGELPDGRPYFVMSYADRGTLADRMRERPLPVNEALAYAEEIAYGVEVINSLGVIHRDLKPSNVLFQSTRNGRERLLIADLGLAKALAHASGAFTLPVGTPGYMSPEQARFGGGLDVRADVYGLGALTYHMVAGRPPGPPPVKKRPSELREEVPPALDEVILRALEVEREKRYPTAEAFAEALSTLRPTGSPSTPPSTPPSSSPTGSPSTQGHGASDGEAAEPSAAPAPPPPLRHRPPPRRLPPPPLHRLLQNPRRRPWTSRSASSTPKGPSETSPSPHRRNRSRPAPKDRRPTRRATRPSRRRPRRSTRSRPPRAHRLTTTPPARTCRTRVTRERSPSSTIRAAAAPFRSARPRPRRVLPPPMGRRPPAPRRATTERRRFPPRRSTASPRGRCSSPATGPRCSRPPRRSTREGNRRRPPGSSPPRRIRGARRAGQARGCSRG
ncbi:serine/threonine-protein kinase [Actinomadura keratinilytica]|uniref:serine/threonine-protein kinase n=1 Tax=Actinomadura keratinilytica TaxID=547461 RepID=UPI00360EEEAA